MSGEEGLTKAIRFLSEIVIQKTSAGFWNVGQPFADRVE